MATVHVLQLTVTYINRSLCV